MDIDVYCVRVDRYVHIVSGLAAQLYHYTSDNDAKIEQ